MLNEQPEVFQITAESDPELWDTLQRPEDRRRTYTEEEIPGAEIQRIFGDLPEQVIDEPAESAVGIKAIYRNTQEKLDDLQRQVTQLTLRTACSVHGLGDRNIARIREEIAELRHELEDERSDAQRAINRVHIQLAEINAAQSVDGMEIATAQTDIRSLEDRVDELECADRPCPVAGWLRSFGLLAIGAGLALTVFGIEIDADRVSIPSPAAVLFGAAAVALVGGSRIEG